MKERKFHITISSQTKKCNVRKYIFSYPSDIETPDFYKISQIWQKIYLHFSVDWQKKKKKKNIENGCCFPWAVQYKEHAGTD